MQVKRQAKRIGVLLLLACVLGGCKSQKEDLTMQGYAALEQKDYETAERLFTQALDAGENQRLAYRGRGLSQMGQSDYDKAAENLEKALKESGAVVDQLDLDINYYLATAYQKNGDEHKAIGVYDAVLALWPQKREALYLRGSSLLKQGDYEAACRDFEQYLALDKLDMDGLIRICELLKNAGYQEIAQEYLSATLETADSKSMTDYDRGRICYYQEQYDSAKTYLEKARGAKTADIILYLGKTYEALGDYNYAASVYSGFLQQVEEDARIENELGLCKLKQGDYEGALAAFQAGLAIENGGDQDQALSFNEIVTKEYLGQFDEAAVLMKKYLEKYPDDEDAKREYTFLKTR